MLKSIIASMFMKDNILYFSVLLISLSGLILGNAGLGGWVRKFFFCSYFLKEMVENLYYCFLECLGKFTSKLFWPTHFFFWKGINFWFNFFGSYWSTHILFLPVGVFPICIFQEIFSFYLNYWVGEHRVVHSILCHLFNILTSALFTLLLFTILVIGFCFFLFCFDTELHSAAQAGV